MTDEEAADAAIPATRDQILKEYADGSLALKIIIDPKDKLRFLKLLPEPGLRIAFVRLVEEHEARKVTAPARPKVDVTAKGAYGQLAQKLRTHINWMGNPKVWAAFGTDAQYCEWLRDQECAFCSFRPDWVMDDYVRCECAHVRRIANGAGEAIKPPFSAIPLCPKCHRTQHQHGENHLGGKEWFDKKRIEHVQEWLWHQMKQLFCIGSMRELPPEDLYAYAEQAGLIEFLPDCYKEGAT